MKAAVVRGAGQVPAYGDFAEPVAGANEVLVHVTASALSHVARSRASGAHYSSSGQFPFIAGVDGVGRLEDGRRVYFAMPRAPFGAMAERVAMSPRQLIALPDGLDDVTAAAIANPGMSSWAALIERARLNAGEAVLVNGATGAAGRLAVQIAKHLGAGKVIATGRNVRALEALRELGADEIIALGDPDLDARLEAAFAAGVDVVTDCLWGASAERVLIAGASAEARPIRFVQVGAASGGEITLPSAVLRSSAIEMMGSGIGSIPIDRFVAAIHGVLHAAAPGGFRIATKTAPLADVEQRWLEDGGAQRTVFMVAAPNHLD